MQLKAAQQIVDKGLTVRATEALVRRMLQSEDKPAPSPEDEKMRQLQQQLGEHFDTTVAVRHNPKGKGKLEIRYASLNELDTILEKLSLPPS